MKATRALQGRSEISVELVFRLAVSAIGSRRSRITSPKIRRRIDYAPAILFPHFLIVEIDSERLEVLVEKPHSSAMWHQLKNRLRTHDVFRRQLIEKRNTASQSFCYGVTLDER